ncbi:MAG: response regulator [Xanthomonadales bacterium]|nr:response regulator [Xanthomonadales bacterium]
MDGGSVLIVEDHTMIATWLTSVLSAAGCRTTLAGDLEQARRHLDTRRFDLWLCDLHLPDGRATELLDRPGRPPAVVLTADLDETVRRQLAAAGFDAVLAKPCAPDALLATLARLLPAARSAPASPVQPAVRRHDAGEQPLDDDMALRSCGDTATVRALRELLAAELRALPDRLGGPWTPDSRDAVDDELHRLAAAARWCGALALARHLDWLRPRLVRDPDPDRLRPGLLAQLQRLRAAIDDWLDAGGA